MKALLTFEPISKVRSIVKKLSKVVVVVGISSFCLSAQAQIGSTPTSASYLGGTGTDYVAAAEIQSDGTVVVAANIGSARPGGLTPLLLNGATSSSSGAILRLSADGRTVLSVTRLADVVKDISLDGTGNIYVAARSAGLFKLNPTASSIIWSRTNGGAADRVDSASNGYSVALKGSFADANGYEATGAGTIFVHDASGNQVGTFAGHNRTHDVCIDTVNQSVFLIGYQNKNSPYNPVQVCYIDSRSYTGTRKWKSYDWSGSQVDSPNENNMADTRGLRISMGADGYLYGLFMSAGGNHIFRRDPFDLTKAVTLAGGDKYHQFYNTKSEHKTFFGKYNPTNGAYIQGQQFCARLVTGEGNTAWCEKGNIKADATGRVYIVGFTGSGGGSNNTADGLPYTFDPVPSGEYGGGPFVLAMTADFKTRLFCGRLCSAGYMHAVAARVINGNVNMFFGGQVTSSTLYTKNPIQSSSGGTHDGFFASVLSTTSGNAAPSVSISSPASGTTYTAPAIITINASAADSDGTVSKVEFFNGTSLLSNDTSSPYSHAWSGVAVGNYSLTAKATDNGGASTTSSPVTVTVNASSSSSSVNTPPTVSITSPANGATYNAPASVVINANASDSNGSVSNVEFFSGSSLLGSDATSPYSITWSSVVAGNYGLSARATDNASASTTSATVNIVVNLPPSGSLTGTKGTQPATLSLNTEGSRDWSHWGLNVATDWNHKSGVTAQISNITKIGTATLNRYTDGTMACSWTGGTPTASASSSRAGVYVAGVNNGFQITVPADTTARTLRVYCGLWKSQGKLEATLSDGSAPAFVDTTHGSTTGSANTMFTINYKAANAGQSLTVKWTVQTSHDTAGNGTVGWQSATLQ